jgi:hypothetical protein
MAGGRSVLTEFFFFLPDLWLLGGRELCFAFNFCFISYIFLLYLSNPSVSTRMAF